MSGANPAGGSTRRKGKYGHPEALAYIVAKNKSPKNLKSLKRGGEKKEIYISPGGKAALPIGREVSVAVIRNPVCEAGKN